MSAPASPPGAAARGPILVDVVSLKERAATASGVLAAVRLGGLGSTGAPASLPWLVATIPQPRLDDTVVAELWPAVGPVERDEARGVAAAADGASYFATIAAGPVDDRTLEAATFDAYDRLLCAAQAAGYPHLVRVWNFVPAINHGAGDRERYKLFCTGRSDAFREHAGEALPRALPAASALGCEGTDLIVHAVAAREPGRPIENPRQVSAYLYPERYGPKSPSFARGMLAPAPWSGGVFVSGTASIAGHESRHPGDPAAQTHETLTNIEAVLDAAGARGGGAPLGRRVDALRVYVRSRAHVGAVRESLERRLGAPVPTVWLEADICRAELLVEIEATVLAPRR